MNSDSFPRITTSLSPSQLKLSDANRGHWLTINRGPLWWNVAYRLDGPTVEWESITERAVLRERLEACVGEMKAAHSPLAAPLSRFLEMARGPGGPPAMTTTSVRPAP